MPKLKLRSLQDAMTCIQDTKTHSFTEGDISLFSHVSNHTSSTCKQSNSPPDIGDDRNNVETETLIPRASTISSHRFFFSPHTTKSIMEEAGHGRRKAKAMGVFGEERATTMAMSMSSSDPYRDFRRSMEEMVEAHGIQERPQMQELLQCYLRLNDRRTHSTILLAFVDLLMCRIEFRDN